MPAPVTLPAGAEKRAVVEAMFDRIAPRYDLMNRLMTFGIDRGWRRRAIATLQLRPGDRVLDLACGSGDLAAVAAECGACVLALDFSAGMLRTARARGVGALVRGDALALPLAAGAVDAITSGFALRNFVDLAAAFAECGRVLRPGGRLALLEVDRPANILLRLGHAAYFRHVVPALGALLADRAAYAYLPASTAYLPDAAALVGMLRRAGFGGVAKEPLLGGAAQLVTAVRGGEHPGADGVHGA
jgi:demethylmenaquinone methyltransferase / 2-methoxy-6-polyprenyl-1,4-benzoquinol methylase